MGTRRTKAVRRIVILAPGGVQLPGCGNAKWQAGSYWNQSVKLIIPPKEVSLYQSSYPLATLLIISYILIGSKTNSPIVR